MSHPWDPVRRRGLAGAAAVLLAAALGAAPAPAGAQVHEDGVRTPRPPARQTPPAAKPDPHDRQPDRAREDALTRPRHSPASRRDAPGTRPAPNDGKKTKIDFDLPGWAKDSVGLHPLHLSLNVQTQYAAYLEQPHPLVFVVSRHGRYANWRYCRDGEYCGAATAARTALRRCDAIGIDGPCSIYAVGRDRLWKGKVEMDATLGAAVLTADGTEHRGAEKAKGVIFYFRGYGAWRFPPRLSYHRVPPYLRRFASHGWDVNTVEVPYYNRPPRNLPRIVELIRKTVAAARSQGYKRVVLAGQSRGSWEILRATDGSLPVDAVIVVAPAAHGTRRLSNGRVNANFARGNPAFAALVKTLKAPRIAFAFFRRDPFMPATRAGLARTGLAGREGVQLFMIDQPEGLPGHNAAWSSNFARAWGACLERFVEAPARPGTPFACTPARFKIDKPELIYSTVHLAAHGSRPVTPAALKALIAGKTLYTAPEPRQDAWWTFGRDGRVAMKLTGAWERDNPVRAYWELRGSRVCILGSPIHGGRVFCYTVSRVADNVLAFAMKSGIVRLMYVR